MKSTTANPVILEYSHRRQRTAGGRWFVTPAICLFLLHLLLWGCARRAPQPESTVMLSDAQSLLILPFVDMTEIYGESAMIKCPICANYFVAGNVAPGAEAFMTGQLAAILKRSTQFQVLTRAHPRRGLTGTSSERHWGGAERARLVETGRDAGTELVMTGYIYRFKQRVGTRYAVDSPASVALSVHIVSTADGRNLWNGTIDETQSALSEDLFELKTFLKRKGTWVTAEEMAVAGLEALLEELPLK